MALRGEPVHTVGAARLQREDTITPQWLRYGLAMVSLWLIGESVGRCYDAYLLSLPRRCLHLAFRRRREQRSLWGAFGAGCSP